LESYCRFQARASDRIADRRVEKSELTSSLSRLYNAEDHTSGRAPFAIH
jgi:hypothetical protein